MSRNVYIEMDVMFTSSAVLDDLMHRVGMRIAHMVSDWYREEREQGTEWVDLGGEA